MPGVVKRDVTPDPLDEAEETQWERRLTEVLANAPDKDDAERVEDIARTLMSVASPTVDEVLRAQLAVQRYAETWPEAAELLVGIAKRRVGSVAGTPPWLV